MGMAHRWQAMTHVASPDRRMVSALGYWHSAMACVQVVFFKTALMCLAQVAFNMFIPCMLFTKVASTLAAQPHISLLAIPAVAVMQASLTKCSVGSFLFMGSLNVDASATKQPSASACQPCCPLRPECSGSI